MVNYVWYKNGTYIWIETFRSLKILKAVENIINTKLYNKWIKIR